MCSIVSDFVADILAAKVVEDLGVLMKESVDEEEEEEG